METLYFKSALTELDRLSELTCVWAARYGWNASFHHAIHLILDELLTNIITYGMAEQDSPVIEVKTEFTGDVFSAVIRDNGASFDPGQAKEPDLNLPIEEREPGGLGIFLVRSKVDEMHYRQEEGWNVLSLRKRL